MNWADLDKLRGSVERYYLRQVAKNNINIPLYDQFVTEVRKDWERAGYDLSDEADLYKLWATLAVTLSAAAHLLEAECETKEQMTGGLKVMGAYGNMTGLFLREMTKNVPTIPAAVVAEDKRPEEDAHE